MYTIGSVALVALVQNFAPFLEILHRLQGKFIRPQKVPPDDQRKKAQLNPEGETISVELALNSRCTSDYDGYQKVFHWGLFDPNRALVSEDIQRLISRVQIPRFTDGTLEIQTKNNLLYFLMANEEDDLKRSWMMIESGMQQQIVCLLCAAFGVGMVLKGLSDNGTKISDSVHANMRMKLDAMHPSYSGSYWSEDTPEGVRPWLKANLPSPNRNGKKSLTKLVAGLNTKSPVKTGTINTVAVSQLLWAARGRTPHYYKSKPWGMTIPVSRGHQNISNVLLLHAGRLLRYVNWDKGRPTHRLDPMHGIENEPYLFQNNNQDRNHNCRIILSRNEKNPKALWEIGFQLINIILQAKALEIDVRPYLLDDEWRKRMEDVGIMDPWGVVSLKVDDLSLA